MGLLDKIKLALFGSKKRKLRRDDLQKFVKVQAIIEGKKYSLKDFTIEGFALINDVGSSFEVGKSYQCMLTLRGEPRVNFKVIVRRAGKLVGCEAVEKDLLERFINSNLKL